MTKQVSAIGISELKINQVDKETVALVLIDSKEKPHGFFS